MLIDILQRVRREGPTDISSVQVATWYDRYSAAQLFAGSCTPQTYATAVRPRMAACNPSFSGLWAREYEKVVNLLPVLNTPNNGVLQQVLTRNRLVHISLARLLVPGGGSLLKTSGRRKSDPVTDSERDQFDAFFMIERRPTCVGEFQYHMLRRLAAAQCDLTTHPIRSDAFCKIQELLPGDLTDYLRESAIELAELA
ncbi:hypothetical protein [Nocardia gamkensis]|uniref:hypothetical protein n=1 Tax=Nocardia gamkensis TaxID=352869 RepID=UPI0037C722D4